MSWQRAPLWIAGLVVLGAAGTIGLAWAAGMGGRDLVHLAVLLAPAGIATILISWAAARLLMHASLRRRLPAAAIIGVVVALLNLGVLAASMAVDRHDVVLVGLLLLYSGAAGVSAGLLLARGPVGAVQRLSELTARLPQGGEPMTEVSSLGGGPELDSLGRVIVDTSERLRASIEMERQAEARRRDLITAVSHDLRTPLTGLRAVIEAIDDGVVGDPTTLRRYLDEARHAVDTLVLLVNDLLELTALDAGVNEAEPDGRLADVVDEAVEACESQARAKGLVVRSSLDGAAGAACSRRLVRVLQNLVQNAIRHTPADGSIRVEARRVDGGLEIAVVDSGEGIPADVVGRVFDPFWRGDAARSTPGAGLGLALAKRIVEALGGEIGVRSAPTDGTTFTVRLPVSGGGGLER
jgi:signal transduction histidine kinase